MPSPQIALINSLLVGVEVKAAINEEVLLDDIASKSLAFLKSVKKFPSFPSITYLPWDVLP